MRKDGMASFYVIQHRNPPQDEWHQSNPSILLFTGLSVKDRLGEKGRRYRELIELQDASTPLWQEFGVFGFTLEEDARRALVALRDENPVKLFRIVHRTITQHTEVVDPITDSVKIRFGRTGNPGLYSAWLVTGTFTSDVYLGVVERVGPREWRAYPREARGGGVKVLSSRHDAGIYLRDER